MTPRRLSGRRVSTHPDHSQEAHMRKRWRGRWVSLLVAGSLLAPGLAQAQEAEGLRRELEQMREQFDAMRNHYANRLQELRERLHKIEDQKAAPAPAAPQSRTPTAPRGDNL